jgi:hypothetical protein
VYKVAPPSAEENAEELQRSIESIQNAKDRGEPVMVDDSDDSDSQDGDPASALFFTTKDIRSRQDNVMRCIKVLTHQ